MAAELSDVKKELKDLKMTMTLTAGLKRGYQESEVEGGDTSAKRVKKT